MKRSAGVLLYREREGALEVLLAHPGGPFYRNKDAGAWTIPKGELDDSEEPRTCAARELVEETGISIAVDALRELGEIKQRGGKLVIAFAARAPLDLQLIDPPKSNTFEVEWPPRSGKRASFPEVDRVAFFALPTAREKMLASQLPLLDLLDAQAK